jgi:sugar lactone lactonase YvrE
MTKSMRKILSLSVCILVLYSVKAQLIVTSIAGTGIASYSGDGGPAINARINNPYGICVDKEGNLLFTDTDNNRVRKISKDGIITTIAGTGIAGYSGDGGQATAAQLLGPIDVALDNLGNIYIADGQNCRVRKIDTAGIISTVAGNGNTWSVCPPGAGDGGLATNAIIQFPAGVCVDNSGNIYIADIASAAIRRVDFATGIITTIAGDIITWNSGCSGIGGPSHNALLAGPVQLKIFGDYLYFTDINCNDVRKMNLLTGRIDVWAGKYTSSPGYAGDGGPATLALLNSPTGIFIDTIGNVYVGDYLNGSVRKIDTSDSITTIAGVGVPGYAGDGRSPTDEAAFYPVGICMDSYGCIYIADSYNNRIRKIYDKALSTPLPVSLPLTARMYPNPVKDKLTIEWSGGAAVFELYEVATGKCVLRTELQGRTSELDMKTIVSGCYFAFIKDGEGSVMNKTFLLK